MFYWKKRSIGDYFSDIIAAISGIWKESLLVGSAASALILILSMPLAKQGMAVLELALEAPENPEVLFALILPLLGRLALSAIPLFIAGITVPPFYRSLITSRLFALADGEEIGMIPLLKRTALRFWGRITLQDLFIAIVQVFLLIIGLFVMFLALIPTFMNIRGGMESIILFKLFFAYFLFIIYMLIVLLLSRVLFSIAMPASINEDASAFKGIGRSISLIKSSFWRSLGIILLFNLVISLGIGILSGPIVFAIMMPGYLQLLRMSAGQSVLEIGRLQPIFKTFFTASALSLFINFIIGMSLETEVQVFLYMDRFMRDKEKTSPEALASSDEQAEQA